MNVILNEILENADEKYKIFQSKLIPTIEMDSVLGLRAPISHKIAKKYANTDIGREFLSSLPHKYYDENIVHAFMLGRLKVSHAELKKHLTDFLPHVDNWAVCDGLVAHTKSFFNEPSAYGFTVECIKSGEAYTVRFGLVSLLCYYIDKEHIFDVLEICKSIKGDEYYVNMALAWLISFCLIKEYEKSIPLIESKTLGRWVQNKSIQKACESYQIDENKKTYLRSLKIK